MHRNALFFVSDFHPGAETLAERFVNGQGGLLSEGLIWRLVCQLLGALRATHAAGAALRNMHMSRVLYSRVGDRVRVNWVGCLDVLEFETRKQASGGACGHFVCFSVSFRVDLVRFVSDCSVLDSVSVLLASFRIFRRETERRFSAR